MTAKRLPVRGISYALLGAAALLGVHAYCRFPSRSHSAKPTSTHSIPMATTPKVVDARRGIALALLIVSSNMKTRIRWDSNSGVWQGGCLLWLPGAGARYRRLNPAAGNVVTKMLWA